MALDSGPATKLRVITESDTTTYGGSRALWVGTAGDLVVDTATETDITIKNVANGTLVPISILRIKAATTAADIVALY